MVLPTVHGGGCRAHSDAGALFNVPMQLRLGATHAQLGHTNVT